jgi:hypothetical protein
MNDEELRQMFAELIVAEEQAFTVLALAVGEAVGRAPMAAALEKHLANAQAVARNPMRDRLLATAVQTLKQTLT